MAASDGWMIVGTTVGIGRALSHGVAGPRLYYWLVTADLELIEALVSADEAAAILAIEGGADANAVEDKPAFLRRSALQLAARAGLTTVVLRLLDAGASLGMTEALRAATRRGDSLTVTVLLDSGADPNDVGRGRTSTVAEAIDHARHRPGPRSVETIDRLLARGARIVPGEESLVVRAARDAAPAVLRLLVRYGESPDTRRSDGAPVIVLAARCGNTAAVDVLVEHGADVDATDGGGRTALMYAVERGFHKIVNILLLAGASADLRSDDGATALLLAQAWGEDRIRSMLGERRLFAMKVEAPLSLIRSHPRRYELRGAPARLRQLAGLVEFALAELGDGEFHTIVGTDASEARALVVRLMDDEIAASEFHSWHSIEVDESEHHIIRASLLAIAGGPIGLPPPSFTKLDMKDMLEDFIRPF
jgi:hypothetical protein